jgi:hypothetical protein
MERIIADVILGTVVLAILLLTSEDGKARPIGVYFAIMTFVLGYAQISKIPW